MNPSTRLVLQLLSRSSLIGVVLVTIVTAPTKANSFAISQSDAKPISVASTTSCDASLTKADVAGAARKLTSEESMLDFSAAESDAAVILLGCDCPGCINVIRQLRNQSLFDAVQGHCQTKLTNNNSQQTIDQVLEAIEVAEASGPDTPLVLERP